MILRYGFFSAMFAFQVRCLKPENCDPSLNSLFREGILGPVGMFPWLGVIRVELHEGENVRIALTGAVLIKKKYALTIADDIARMPRRIFERDSKALFIPNDGERWLCKLKNYTTHPEYPAVMNTIAIIELELEEKEPVPLVPICWPTRPYLYNESSQLYVLGITDVNDILEKEAYKVKHVGQTPCIQWYYREGLITRNDPWRAYQCVSTENNKKSCLFETGMILASNATGTWTLVAFGIHGPGCASPSRFIDLYKYLPWIESTTSDVRLRGAPGKLSLRERFEGGEKDVPIHELFRSDKEEDLSAKVTPWIFDRYESGLVPEIVRIDKNAIVLFHNKYELDKGDCSKRSKLIYTDAVRLVADRQGGKAYYQLSLMDLSVFNYTCIYIRVESKRRSKAQLWYNYGSFIDTLEGVDETPKRVVKKYPVPARTTAEPDQESGQENSARSATEASKRFGRRIIENSRRYKKLISDSVINELLAIKNELETTRKELNITGKADINKTFKKMFAVKDKLVNVRDKLGSPAPDSLKNSIDVLDKTASELRAGQVFYQGKLMDVRKQEVQQSIDLIKEFRETPEYIEIALTTDKPEVKVEETIKKPKAKGRQGKKKPWKPHKFLEPEYITDKPGWWLYHPHLNLEFDFQFDDEAELSLEIWSHLTKIHGTRAPKTKPTRTRNYTDELDWEESRRVYADGEVEQNDAENEVEQNQEENLNDQQPSKSQDQERTGTEYGTSLRKISKFNNPYSELKRAEYYDLEVSMDESNIARPEKLFVIAAVLCMFM
ncbi:uncharacterized protein [Choristoneura fumiferana]|uniref:uncharacterized protein n=1 Tax=Choristoneura fumiferana TaxID=7141 RepID=UPI003D15483D